MCVTLWKWRTDSLSNSLPVVVFDISSSNSNDNFRWNHLRTLFAFRNSKNRNWKMRLNAIVGLRFASSGAWMPPNIACHGIAKNRFSIFYENLSFPRHSDAMWHVARVLIWLVDSHQRSPYHTYIRQLVFFVDRFVSMVVAGAVVVVAIEVFNEHIILHEYHEHRTNHQRNQTK